MPTDGADAGVEACAGTKRWLRAGRIRRIDTHISTALLAGAYACRLRKPVERDDLYTPIQGALVRR